MVTDTAYYHALEDIALLENQRNQLRERAETAELQVNGLAYLVKNCEKQIEQLREALEELTYEADQFAKAVPPYGNSEPLSKARAALKATEEG